MSNHYETALTHWENIKTEVISFGREAKLAIRNEGVTIHDFSIALCGTAELEDRIGRYIMAAEFHDSLPAVTLRMVEPWLSPGHYTELRKHENAYGLEAALDLMQDLIVEQPDGRIQVKSVDWLRGRRASSELSTDEMKHRFWKKAARMLAEMMGELERKGLTASKQDRRMVRLLKLIVSTFRAEMEQS